MNLDSIYKIFNALEDDKLCFLYQGNFIDKITTLIIHLIEQSIESKSGFSKLRNKISYLMVESFQNIIRHGDNAPVVAASDSPGIFITRNLGQAYYIISANLIENENIPKLREKLDNVNTLNKNELKNLYFEVLTKQGLSDKGGAGLGLIQMARKSGQKLEFDFVKINDKLSYFYFQLKLKSKKAAKLPGTDDLKIDSARELHQLADKENVFIIHKGNFSQEAIKPVIRMVESNLGNGASEQSIDQRIAFHLLVEILQNISKHSYNANGIREGIFMMGLKNKKYIISTGNFIENSKIGKLSAQLNALNSLGKDELDKLYKKVLREGKITEGGGAGLGLIDIARESRDNLEFGFTPISNDVSFFSLVVKL